MIPKRVEDLRGTVFGKLTVISYKGTTSCSRKRHRWEVQCLCGRKKTLTRCNIKKNLTGCGSCLNPVEDMGDYIRVDVSTETYPNTYTILDKECKYLFESVRWSAYRKTSEGLTYVSTNSRNYKSTELHNVVNDTPEGMHTDHISGNTLDNRKENLRTVTPQDNTRNSSRSKNNTSGITGVSLKADGTYRAYITVNRKQIHLGNFSDKIRAIVARLTAEMKYGFHKNHGRA